MAQRKLRAVSATDQDSQGDEEPQWESGDQIRVEKKTWLCPNRIPDASITVLEGDKCAGKSTFAVFLTAAITIGKGVLGGKKRPPRNVVWSAGEEDIARDVLPRLEAAGADMRRVKFPPRNNRGERQRVILPSGFGSLQKVVDQHSPGLIVLDPLSSHVPPDTDLKHDQSIHSILDPVADLAQVSGSVVLLTRNLVKSKSGSRLHHGLGGAGLGGVARSILVIDQPDERSLRRVLRVVRCNNGSPVGPVEYYLTPTGKAVQLTKLKELDLTLDDPNADLVDVGERDVRADAKVLLHKFIGNDWVNVAAVLSEAETNGIGQRTLRSVKAELGVRSRRIGTTAPARWEWGPPQKGWQ